MVILYQAAWTPVCGLSTFYHDQQKSLPEESDTKTADFPDTFCHPRQKSLPAEESQTPKTADLPDTTYHPTETLEGSFWAFDDASRTSGAYVPNVDDTDQYIYNDALWGTTPGPAPTTGSSSGRGSLRNAIFESLRKLTTNAISKTKPYDKEFANRICLNCRVYKANCGEHCYWNFNNQVLVPSRDRLEIRRTGNMGYGVFVRQGETIAEHTKLGVYTGELIPFNHPSVNTSDYVFQLHCPPNPNVDNEVAIDSSRRGNWTRFINSHCVPNVSARVELIGKVLYVVFSAKKRLTEGEQLFISYGPQYFTGAQGQGTCQCDAQPGPHIPPPLTESRRD
ncbi:hypothetical protein B0T16DRAFT_117243 [Cercophora newfieldiana]|uniref:SET domain-containing protein n=1 Tax=Cercophora newfieldiana TaxID=92897 RepID=A0AA39Y9N3_9PEZI|nr:hypothetical protein B0T16DRAFT_117243 [Cercophora newfieldiana]